MSIQILNNEMIQNWEHGKIRVVTLHIEDNNRVEANINYDHKEGGGEVSRGVISVDAAKKLIEIALDK
jgi:hypothetical protein